MNDMDTDTIVSPLSLQPYKMSIQNLDDVVKKIQDLIQIYGLRDILEVIEPIYEIYTASELYLPEMAKTKKYIRSFHKLLKYHLPIINSLLRVTKVLKQNSANGKVFVVEVYNASWNVPKLLIKVPLTKTSDPISYEYYIGMALNQLRIIGVREFSLVYGRFRCGIDPNNINMLCTERNGTRISTHILYEYVESNKRIVKSMYAYIAEYNGDPKVLNINIINVLILLCVGLQKAQDNLNFTHYDLHLNNILLVELDEPQEMVVEYNSKMIKIYTNLIPYIIDYGRCHISHAISDQDDGTFRDYENNVKYSTFKSYQENIWAGKSFRVKDNVKSKIQKYLNKIKGDSEFSKYLTNHMKGKTIENFYVDNETNEVTYGIKPAQFHPVYDMYRMVRTTCKQIINKYVNQQTNSIWKTMDMMLQYAYPFYIPEYYVLPTNYKSLNGQFSTPIDVANFLYSLAYKNEQKGGGRVYKKMSYLMEKSNQMTKETRDTNNERYLKIYSRVKLNLEKVKAKKYQTFDSDDLVIYDTIELM